jgi:hypothetical protein
MIWIDNVLFFALKIDLYAVIKYKHRGFYLYQIVNLVRPRAKFPPRKVERPYRVTRWAFINALNWDEVLDAPFLQA